MTTLLVSSVGGHLAQLHRLASCLEGVDSERCWVTFDTPQSRSLLSGEEVVYVDYTGPRELGKILRHTRVAHGLLAKGHNFSSAISAGSGIALAFLPLAASRGVQCHYVESFTRSSGPSATGRALSRIPGIELYTQYPDWASRRWGYAGSVFDAFAPGPLRPELEIRSAVVTLGTMEDYPFRRLVERALAILPPHAEVLWQVGCTPVSDLPIEAHVQLESTKLRAAVEAADLVIAHAGCGSALMALEAGKGPLLVPREAARGENVDDHQKLLARELTRRGLATVSDVEALSRGDVLAAARATVLARATPAFSLRTR
jgi:UDP-N-acetylglucosamine--N-acetylmuramyl-(pentapeptide) pyrophosphoryl-undecaprenol N-acetylglucosamine transferase